MDVNLRGLQTMNFIVQYNSLLVHWTIKFSIQLLLVKTTTTAKTLGITSSRLPHYFSGSPFLPCQTKISDSVIFAVLSLLNNREPATLAVPLLNYNVCHSLDFVFFPQV